MKVLDSNSQFMTSSPPTFCVTYRVCAKAQNLIKLIKTSADYLYRYFSYLSKACYSSAQIVSN